MSQSVNLPALGESVTEGTVTRWLKNVGDHVEVDEPLLEVSTDKVDTEIPSPIAGVIEEILVAEDETVEVGAPLVRIGDGNADGGDSGEAAPAAQEPVAESPAEQPAAQEPTAEAPEEAAPAEAAPAEAAPAAAAPEEAAPAAEAPQQGGASDGQSVTLPSLGESVTEGTVTRLLKQVGDSVEMDEPLLEISTDKVDTEIPSPVAGVVQAVFVAEDQTIEVGAELMRIGSEASASPQAAAPEAPAATESSETPAAEAPTETPAQTEYLPSEAPTAEAPAAAPSTEQQEPAPAAPEQQAEAEKPEAEAGEASMPAAPEAPAAPPAPAAVPAASSAPSSSTAGNAGYVTPLVRKLAAEHGVDLATVTGTGVGGRIRKEDVLAATAPAESAPAAEEKAAPSTSAEVSPLRGTTVPMTRLRKVVAERAVISMQSSAQLTSVVEVDVSKVAALRTKVKDEFLEKTGTKLSFLPFFALAAAEALRAYPIINATIDGESIVYPAQENISIAVDTERGLLTPVIRDAGSLDIAGLAKEIADLAERTRDNKLKPDELAGGTFTLTNTGSRGALFDTPVVFLPQSAILGTGIVTKRPVVVGDNGTDAIAIRSMVYLALSYDHRIIDGADASRFLVSVKQRLEAGDFSDALGL
jgi:pyruvate dehydrogenase E2 component (dihydrolipoamide acetyltransferase)